MNGSLFGTCHVFLRSAAAGEGMDRNCGAGQNLRCRADTATDCRADEAAETGVTASADSWPAVFIALRAVA
jgi:hypothetical protein